MGFPIANIVMLSVLGVSIFAGLVMWWTLSQRMRSLQFELQPMTMLTKFAPGPANEVINVFDVIDDVPSRDSSIRMRVGFRATSRVDARPSTRLRAVK